MMNGGRFLTVGSEDVDARTVEEYLAQHPYDAGAWSRWGYVLWKKGRLREALEALEKALQLDPDDRETIRHCVAVLVECGREKDARDILQACIDRAPADPQLQEWLDRLPARQKGTFTECQRNDEEADIAAILVRVGEEEFQKGCFHQARICFEIAVGKNPQDAQAYNNLGVLYWKEGDLSKALEYFSQALDRAPRDGEIVLNCARVLSAAEHHETASQLLELYLSEHPQDTAVWSEYRDMILRLGQAWRPDGLDGKAADVYLQMGDELSRCGDLQGAGEAYARALRIRPEHPEGYLRLGRLYMQLGSFEEAVEVLEQGRFLDGQSAEILKALERARGGLERQGPA